MVPPERGFAMGIRQAGAPVGGALGAALFPLLATYAGYQRALLVGGSICALTAVIAAARYAQPPDEPPMTPKPVSVLLHGMRDFAARPAGVAINVTGFLLASVQYTVVAFFIISLLGQHVPRALAASSLVIMQATAILARPFWGYLSDRTFRGNRTQPLAVICVLV